MNRRDLLLGAAVCVVAAAAFGDDARLAGTLQPDPRFTYDHGGIVRGDRSKKQLALVFTGGDFGEGVAPILDTLRDEKVPASLFVTGGFLKQPGLPELLGRAVREGHYVGPHSDKHLLYAT